MGAEGYFGFRNAEKKDACLVLKFIRKIAEYERMSRQVVATRELLEEFVFDRKAAEVLIGEAEGRPVGFALYFENFSTFLGRTGLHLEDLFEDPDQRGKGYGKQLFQAVARIAAERGCQRLEWACLNWNQPSIDFYHYMGAVPLEEWTTFRLAGGAIEAALEK